MNKNANLRKKIKDLIDSEHVQPPKKKQIMKSPSLRQGSSEVNLKIKDLRLLLQDDLKKSNEKLTTNPLTRDISHLQDKKTPTAISLPILPTDIQVLRKMKSTEFKNLHTPSRCKRENCLDAAFFASKKGGEVDAIERMLMGNPTGRQDIKELCTWFNTMLEAYQDSDIDTIMLIYEICAKELTRQVAVQCIERGELLQILFTYQPDILKRKIEELHKDLQKQKLTHSNEIDQIKSKVKKLMNDLSEKNFLIQKILISSTNEKKKVSEELNKLKLRYNEFVRKYNEEEKIWKNKHINLLVKLRDSFSAKANTLNINGKLGVNVDLNPAEKFISVDANSIINQEIMEYEASLDKSGQQTEILLDPIDEIDTDKILEIYESLNDEDSQVLQEQVPGIEEKDLNDVEDYEQIGKEIVMIGAETLPDTQETFAQQTAEKSTFTEIPEFFIEFQEQLQVFKNRVLPEIHVNQECSIAVFPDYPRESSSRLDLEFKDQLGLDLEEVKKSQDSELKKKSDPVKNASKKNSKRKTLKPSARKSEIKVIKKDSELQQTIENLKIQLQEKNEIINEFLSAKSPNSTNITENLKLNLGSLMNRGSSNLTPNLPTPRDFISQSMLRSQDLSPRESAFFCSDIGKEIEFDNIEENLIPPGCDVYSWKTGFNSGFEHGKKEGFKEGEILGAEEKGLEGGIKEKDEKIEEVEEKNEEEEKTRSPSRNFTRGVSLRTELFRKKVKEITKVIQFQFCRPGTQKKQHPVYVLISKFMLKSKESLLSSCTLSRKIINKLIGSTFMNCLSKIRTGDHIENLIEQVYDDFYQKYGLKAVSEKRFIEFISSLFTYTSFRRVSMFIKFLGCGGKAQLKSYSRLSFLYYLSSLTTMINLKVGVMVAFDEIADKQMFPTQRGLECVKEKIEWIADKEKLNSILALVQAQSEPDSKGVNPNGLVELELVLELIVDHYEEYQQQIEGGLIAICTAFGFENCIGNFEFLMIIRHVSADRLDFSDDEGKSETLKKLNYSSLLKFIESKDSFTLNEVSTKCINSNLIKIDDVYRFCANPGNLEKSSILEEISSWKAFYENIANEIGNSGKKYKTLDGFQFIERISQIFDQINGKEPYHSLLAWKILESELKRVKNEFLS